MKNNTKIRLHLSKQLFETLTKQVLAEAKANDGYTVAVKQPKQAKETKAQKAAPEVKSTDKMKKMEEKMSSKEKMAKGLYKETDKMKEMGVGSGLSSANIGPGGVVMDDPDWHQSGKAEGGLNESAVDIALTTLGVLGSGALSVAIMKLQDLLQKKDPEAYEKLTKVRGTMGKGNPGLDV